MQLREPFQHTARVCKRAMAQHACPTHAALARCGEAKRKRRSQSTVTSASPTIDAESTTSTTTVGYNELASQTERQYVMVGGKGGVGKTSVSASLGVKLASDGLKTLVVSTDPAHSLSDSLNQDVRGSQPHEVSNSDSMLFALELEPEEARKEFADLVGGDNAGSDVRDFFDGFGLGALTDQLADLKLGELLETPPPGFDEALAISKVVQLANSEEYSGFSRVVFDTAPTGHTVRLLSLPDFLDKSVGKILSLRQKLSDAKNAVGRFFGQDNPSAGSSVDKLERAKSRLKEVSQLFRNNEQMEFVIVAIPTVLSLSESQRLHEGLVSEGVACNRMVVNQVLPERQSGTQAKALTNEMRESNEALRGKLQQMGAAEGAEPELGSASEACENLVQRLSADANFCDMRRKDQRKAIEMLHRSELGKLRRAEAPLLDLELRGVPALQYFGSQLWQ